MRRLTLSLAALALHACGAPADGVTRADRSIGNAGGAAVTSEGMRRMDQDWTVGGCERPEPVPAYVGQAADAAAASLGAPAEEQRFTLGEGMNEFRIELRNDLPLPANASLAVLERTWSKGDCRLTLWSVERDGQWRVVRAMRWPGGAQF